MSTPLTSKPLPRRPGSPPLPPRGNKAGLPPTYLTHLRGLVHQWLEQQVASTDHDTPALAPTQEYRRLWHDERLQEIELAIWNGAMLPHSSSPSHDKTGESSKMALLKVDWGKYALGSARRKAEWKKQLPNPGPELKDYDKEKVESKGTIRSKKPTPASSDIELPKSRLGVISLPQSAGPSGTSTPLKGTGSGTRSPSMISSKGLEESLKSTDRGLDDDMSQEGRKREWCQAVERLDGFRRYQQLKTEEWEVVEDDLPAHEHQPVIPGSFPQSHHFDPPRPSSPPRHCPGPHSTTDDSTYQNEILKPIFIIHFPASTPTRRLPSSSSTSTIRLRRDSTTSTSHSHDYHPPLQPRSKSWWGRRESESTLHHFHDEREVVEENVEVEFVEGQFVLPTFGGARRGSKHRKSTSLTRARAVRDGEGVGTEAPSEEDEGDDEDGEDDEDEDEEGSTWSGTQRGLGKRRRDLGYTAILSGGENDIPLIVGDSKTESSEKTTAAPADQGEASNKSVEGDVPLSSQNVDTNTPVVSDTKPDTSSGNTSLVRVVGGTIIVKGISDPTERQALEKIFRVILYTIQNMYLELELLDAFRIPRESDPPPTPPPPPPQNPRYKPLNLNLNLNLLRQHSISTSVGNPPTPDRKSFDSDRLGRSGSGKKKDKDRKNGGGSGGIFGRLGRESRGVWDGLIGKNRRGSAGRYDKFSSSVVVEGETGSGGVSPVLSSFTNTTSAPATPHTPITTISASTDVDPLADHPLPNISATTTNSEINTSKLKSHTPAYIGPSPMPTIQLPIERHLQILHKLEALIPSPTPNLKFEMPPILERVRLEDRIRTDKVREELGGGGLDKVKGKGKGIDGLPSHLSLPGSGGMDDKDVRRVGHHTGRALGYRLGGDVRAGLGVLVAGMEGFEGWMRLQKLETLVSVGVRVPDTPDLAQAVDPSTVDAEKKGDSTSSEKDTSESGKDEVTTKDVSTTPTPPKEAPSMKVCQMPKPLAMVFYDSNRDHTLASFLQSMEEQQTQLKHDEDDLEVIEKPVVGCGRVGCEVPMREHETWWYHSGRRVSLKMDRRLGEDGAEERGREGEGRVVGWVECRDCAAKSDPKGMSEVAKLYSWGKFLEVLLFSNILLPPTFCTHNKPTYHLQTHQTSLQITSEPITVLDTRLPKLQVGPNVAKRKTGKVAAEAALDGLAKREAALDCLPGEKNGLGSGEKMKSEIEAFFVGLETRVGVLKRFVLPTLPPEAPPKTEEPIPTPPKQPETSIDESLQALHSVSTEFRQAESNLYDLLLATPPGQLNDVRRQLSSVIKSSAGKLVAWQKKYGVEHDFKDCPLDLPEYVTDTKVHPLPGSSVLVREDEPSSIIAYTLSSLAYFNELTNTTKGSANDDQSHTLSKATETITPSGSDEETTETWTTQVQRKDTPRDLLSLRTLAKKKSDASMSLAPSKLPMSLTPAPNAPSLELSLEQVEGKSQAGDRLGDFVRNISKATAQDPILTYKRSSHSSVSESENNGSCTPKVRSPDRRAGLGRRLPVTDSDAPPSAFKSRSVSSTLPSTPITPQTSSTFTVASNSTSTAPPSANRDGWSSVTSSLGNSFNQLIKLGSEVGDSLGSFKLRTNDRSLSSLIGPLSIMSSMDNSLASFDDRPHIQFSYGIGEKMKISCTVYYATAFDSLRRRCAIDKTMVSSLARSSVWDAQGGKSKASFFITGDKRYIVKELVSKWNVSDTHALLEIAPAYFEHLAGTHNKATSLAKIVGFYSVRTHDLQTSTKRQLNLLVMENLFYKHDITKTYDLKGIETRKVPKSGANGSMTTSTLFDGDWLEGQQKSPILLHPHAKRILQEAITNDTRFLSAQSIMDYSLLLGLDDKRKELVVGLVDAIGSYNLFKTIESRGKLALNRGGDVTIIPPDQYRERFETALRQYFIACPDKWSRVSRKGGHPALTSDTMPSVI